MDFDVPLYPLALISFSRFPLLASSVPCSRAGPLIRSFDNWSGKVSMKCELCNSDPREPKQKLCQSCSEAIARLWNITRQVGCSIAEPITAVEVSVQRVSAPQTAAPPWAFPFGWSGMS